MVFTLVNNLDFIKRLKEVIEHYNLSASLFADKIGVQRSSISHILSGRNKPSLDFILKVTNTFKEVDIYWLLNGKGSFPRAPITSDSTPTQQQTSIFEQKEMISQNNSNSKKIQRIVVFYNDGTFDEYIK